MRSATTTTTTCLLLALASFASAQQGVCSPGLNSAAVTTAADLLRLRATQWNTALINRDWESLGQIIDDNASLCVQARVDLGCYDGKHDVIAYAKLTDPAYAEIMFLWDSPIITLDVDVQQHTAVMFVIWDLFSYQTGMNHSINIHLHFTLGCNGLVTHVFTIGDIAEFAEARIPPISDYNVTRICEGGHLGTASTEFRTGIQDACTGANQQYASVAECESFLSSLAPEDPNNPLFGYGNSIGCRDWHLGLARVDPQTHCPHVGPTGGGRCCTNCFPSDKKRSTAVRALQSRRRVATEPDVPVRTRTVHH
jgi:hypothetical protein